MSILDDAKKATSEAMFEIENLELFRHKVYMLTRTWSGGRIGSGDKEDVQVVISPTPYMRDYSHSVRLQENGVIKAGDVIIKYIPIENYPDESELETKTNIKNVQKFYVINNRIYTVVSIVEGYVYWNVHLRKTNKRL